MVGTSKGYDAQKVMILSREIWEYFLRKMPGSFWEEEPERTDLVFSLSRLQLTKVSGSKVRKSKLNGR
jgi:hypothetical protein